MAKDSKKKDLTPEELAEQKAEGSALRSIFNRRKREGWRLDGSKLTQATLGHYAGPMSQGAINHFFEGRTRLNKETAVRIAALLAVPVSEFSGRLAEEIDQFATESTSAAATSSSVAEIQFTKEMAVYRHRALQKLMSLPKHKIDEWLKYADFLSSADPPEKLEAGGQETANRK